ncbi:hypothetical protein D7X33_03085 [Butyricicoccus sp. 1XD8-22]|nr:hypothetical protein D7X33_03085 [Butyricicoccus sp. 1XD8-22]
MLVQAKATAFDAATRTVSLDLQWENAWKNEVNFDGAYVFLKYRPAAGEAFRSMKLRGAGGGMTERKPLPEGFSLGESSVKLGAFLPETQLGFFVFPEEACSRQTVRAAGIQVPVEAGCAEEIEVFSIEMVYIPEGRFTIGDPKGPKRMGGSCLNGFYTYPDKPMYEIASEKAISLGPEAGMLYCDADYVPGGEDVQQKRLTIPEAFPKGFAGMWYMKHPLTMRQWVQYLNCLTRRQQQRQVWADVSGDAVPHFYVMTDSDHLQDRNAVFCRPAGHGTENPITFYTSAPNRIANGLNWFSAASFACFAGLRPVTELEYTKACRGPLAPVEREFPWGSSAIGRVWNLSGERLLPLPEKPGALANCVFDTHTVMFHGQPKKFTGDGPQWGGTPDEGTFENAPLIEGYSERECRGSSYYGVMELAGTVWEYMVSASLEDGVRFDRSYGTGELTEDGEYEMPSWPSPKTGAGFSMRGGNYASAPNFFVDTRPFGAYVKKTIVFHGGARVGF